MKNNTIKNLAKQITSTVLSSGPYEWPPSCLLFAYQPVRPEQKAVQCKHAGTSEHKDEK